MAVDIGMNTLFTAQEVADRAIAQYGYLLGMKDKYSIENYSGLLLNQIKNLEAREIEMFNKLNIKCSTPEEGEKELERRIRILNKQVINLSGIGLEANFLAPLREQKDEEERLLQFLYSKYWPKVLAKLQGESNIRKIAEESGKEITKNIGEIVPAALNQIFKKNQGGYGLGRKGGSFSHVPMQEGIKSSSQLLTSLMSPAERENIKKLIIEEIKNEAKKDKNVFEKYIDDYNQQNGTNFKLSNINYEDLSKILSITDITSNKGLSLQVTVPYDNSWFAITQKQKSSTFKKEYEQANTTKRKKMDKQLDEINKKIIDKIISSNPNLTSASERILRSCIDSILYRDKTAFLVGEAINDIAGILGEIQSLFYLCVLFGETSAQQVGQQRHASYKDELKNSTQLHVDIILKDMFGVQIKNTSKDLLNRKYSDAIPFAKNDNIDNFLDRVDFEPEEREVIKSVYATYGFNVPYEKQEDSFVRVENNPNYDKFFLGRTLKENVNFANTLFDIFGATLMYMNAEIESSKERTLLYILEGVSAITASSVLKQIRDQLKEATHKRQFNISNTQQKGSQNIVNYMNNGIRKGNHVMSEAQKITLTSSFVFSLNKN